MRVSYAVMDEFDELVGRVLMVEPASVELM